MPQLPSSSPDFKRFALKQLGYDPDSYDMGDDGSVSPISNIQPSKASSSDPVPDASNSPVTTKPPQTSALGALGGHAANSLIPTGAGLGSAAAASWLLGPEVGIPGTIAAIAAGLGGGGAASYAQSAMQSDATKASLAQEQQQHPIASKIGDLAPSALAFNPITGIKNLVSSSIEGDTGILQSLGKLLGPTGSGALTATEKAALANAGVNAGIQGGINTGQQLYNGGPFNYGDLAADTASGAIMNQPWGLGKVLFPHPPTGDVQPATTQQTDDSQQIVTAKPDSSVLGLNSRYTQENAPIISTKKNDAMFNYKENEPVDTGTLANEGGPAIGEDDTGVGELEGMPPSDNKAQDFQRAQVEQQNNNQDDIAQQAKVALENSRAFFNRAVQEYNEQVSQESPDDLAAPKLEGNSGDKYQEDKTTAPLQPDEQQFGLFKNSDPRYIQAVAGLAKKRGISLLQADSILTPKGTAARGSMNQSTRTAKYDPNIATEDTIPHEVAGHGYVDDLLASKIPGDQKLAQRALNIYGGKEGADEAIANTLGKKSVDDIKTSAYGTKAAQKSLWMRDFISRWKNTLGVASDEDVMNHLSRRFRDDAPRGTRGEVGEVGKVNTAGVKNQELNKKNLPEWARERMEQEGLNPKRPLNDIDIQNKSIIDAVKSDPTLTQEQKDNILSKGSPEKGQAARLSELTNKGDTLAPEEIKERDALQSKSDSLKGKWKFQEGSLGRSKEDKLATKDNESSLPFSSLPGFRSVADVIQAKDGPRSLPALKAAGDYLNEKDAKSNEWIGEKNDITKGLSDSDKNLLEEKGIQGVQEGRDTTKELPSELQEPFNKMKALFARQQDEAIAANQPVDRNGVMSPRKKDPNFWPQNLDPNAITMMKGNSAEGNQLRNIWDKYNQDNGMTKEQSKARIDNMLVPQSSSKPDLSHFRGLDVAQGIGLPKELQRPGLDRNFERYSNRFAAGRAFHDNIESKPDIASLFNIKKDPYGKPFQNPQEPLRSPEAANLLSSLRGNDFDPHEGTIKGLESVATAGLLGPPTSMHIAVSSLITSLNDAMPGEQAKMLKAGFSDINGSLKRTYATGLNRYKPKLLRDFIDAHSTTAEKLNSLRDLVSTINGREGLSKYTNAVIQNMGEYLVGSRAPLANMGNKQAIRFMQNLDPTWKQGKTYSPSEQLQLAANYAQQVHGAHDFRSMPQWMLTDNIVHPFVSLMSWNIAQTNRFFKSTITPAVKEGNYAPLITATLGAGIGGYILKEAREAINNKKSPIPSLTELANSSKGIEGNLPLVGYNFAAMASYAGYAGILSTIARDAMDVAYKNPAQGSVFPLDEVLSNSAKTISQSVSAIANSQPSEYFDIGTKAVGDLLRENIQIARMAASWGDQSGVFGVQRQDKKSLNTAEGDLRRYKMAEGMPVDDEGSIDASNPYLNMSRKNFQKEQDIGTAAGEIPDLISQAFKESNGNMEVLRNKLRALKDESYPSMPSPEHTPMTFWRYVEFLKNTQGDAVANQRVQDYFMHNAINKAKSSMVPSL